MKSDCIRFHVKAPDMGTDHRDGWNGRLYPIQLEEQPYEASLNIRGWSYHLIFGEQCNGWFLCVPEWGIGAELADLSDRLWNKSSLIRSGVDEITAACITDALRTINSCLS